MPLLQGTKLGSYEILSPSGVGGMGEVYRARDLTLGRDVAVKILHQSTLHDPDRLRRFRQEAQAAASLNHPNILAIYYVGEHDATPYIVSELLEGESLRDRLLAGIPPVRLWSAQRGGCPEPVGVTNRARMGLQCWCTYARPADTRLSPKEAP